MSEFFKELSDEEVRTYARSIFPIRKKWPFKTWVKTKDIKEDIFKGEEMGIAHVKAWKVLRIKVPTIGYKGVCPVTPEVVLSQLPKIDLSFTNGYSVELGRSVNLYDDSLSNIDPTYYEATVTLYQDKTKRKASTKQEQGEEIDKKHSDKKDEENLFGF